MYTCVHALTYFDDRLYYVRYEIPRGRHSLLTTNPCSWVGPTYGTGRLNLRFSPRVSLPGTRRLVLSRPAVLLQISFFILKIPRYNEPINYP
jgi:hypothetical protein